MTKTPTTRSRRTKTAADKTAADKTSKTPRASRRGRSHGTGPLPPTDLEVAERAYYLYLERTGVRSGELDDWLQAERELRGARGGQ